MTVPTDDLLARWGLLRSGLLCLRDLVRARAESRGSATERHALRRLARHPAFALQLEEMEDSAALERAKWLADRLLGRLEELAESTPSPVVRDRYLDAPRKAVVGWGLLVSQGLRPSELYGLRPTLFGEKPAASDIARRGRVQHALWIGGNHPDRDATRGIVLLLHELTSAVMTGAPVQTELDHGIFSYEWQRLAEVQPEGCLLLGLLSMFSAEVALDISLLRDGSEPLPPTLKDCVRRPRDFDRLARTLRDRGLVTFDDGAIGVRPSIRDALWVEATERQLRSWASLAVRVMKSCLPADSHSAETWPIWRVAYPHVVAVVASAERFDVQLGDLPYLFDRASVFQRDGADDSAQAIELACHGLEISEKLGRPVAEWHSWLMGNLALAMESAKDRPAAIEKMRETADFDREMFGEGTEEYATDLNLLAGMLKHVGRLREAESTYQRALVVMRDVYEDHNSDWNRIKLIEVLNDYAAFLIQRRPGRRAARQAEGNLDEAMQLVKSREYGYIPLVVNRAALWRLQARTQDSETLLKDLLREIDSGTRSASEGQMLGILADLAEVCGLLGKSADEARYNERAHRYDDLLTERRGPSRAGTSA